MKPIEVLRAVVLLSLAPLSASSATIQFLTPFGLGFGNAYGVDGLKVVGESNIGWLYNGTSYQVIQVPWGGTTIPHDVSGNMVVGSSGIASFLYDGVTYTKLTNPLGVNGTDAWGIDGNNIVGSYLDASSKAHGFLFDGTSYTTIDHPLGVNGTRPRDIFGNTIVGSYADSKNRAHGFVYDGTTWTTLDDPLFLGAGITALYGIDGNKIVGNTSSSPASAAFLYDGSSFAHPFGIELPLVGNHQFFGISGNRIVGTYRDKPFVYIIPEPSTYSLALASGVSILFAVYLRFFTHSGHV